MCWDQMEAAEGEDRQQPNLVGPAARGPWTWGAAVSDAEPPPPPLLRARPPPPPRPELAFQWGRCQEAVN